MGRFHVFFAVMAMAGLGGPALARADDGISAQIAEARLVSEVETIRPGEPFWVALRLTMTDGWHTYWRNPGDSGLATAIAWDLPGGYSAGPIHWPTPVVFRVGPITSYGYKGEVWLLTEIIPAHRPDGKTSAVLRADAQWLACEEICVPERANLELALPISAGDDPAYDAARSADFARAREALPKPGVGRAIFAAEDSKYRFAFTVPGLTSQPLPEAWLFPAEYGVIDHGASQGVDVDGSNLVLTAVRDSGGDAPPDAIAGVLVVRQGGGQRAFAVRAVPKTEGSRQ